MRMGRMSPCVYCALHHRCIYASTITRNGERQGIVGPHKRRFSMATSSALAQREMAFTKTGEATSITKPFFVVRTLFGQLMNAMMVARYLRGAGGKFTDEAERE